MDARPYQKDNERKGQDSLPIFVVFAIFLLGILFVAIYSRNKEIQSGMDATNEQIAQAAADACVKRQILGFDQSHVLTRGDLDDAKEKCDGNRREEEQLRSDRAKAKIQRSALNNTH